MRWGGRSSRRGEAGWCATHAALDTETLVKRLEDLREKLFEDYVRLSNSMINETTAFVGGTLTGEFEEDCDLEAAASTYAGHDRGHERA